MRGALHLNSVRVIVDPGDDREEVERLLRAMLAAAPAGFAPFTPLVAATCPLCPRATTRRAAGAPNMYVLGLAQGREALLHSEPTCAAFRDLGVLEFLRAARRARGIFDAGEGGEVERG